MSFSWWILNKLKLFRSWPKVKGHSLMPVTCPLPELCPPSTPNTGIGSSVQTDIETENMSNFWPEVTYHHTLLQPVMFSFLGLGTQSRALGWHSGESSVTEFQQRIQESRGLNLFYLLLQQTQDNSWAFWRGGRPFDSSSNRWPPPCIFIQRTEPSACSRVCSLDGENAEWLDASKTGTAFWVRSWPAKGPDCQVTCHDVRTQHHQKRTSQPASKSLHNNRKSKGLCCQSCSFRPLPLSSSRKNSRKSLYLKRQPLLLPMSSFW